MKGEGGNLSSDGGNAEARKTRRRSNIATRRKPLAEIDEKEVQRAKRRKNKRVSFSETTTIALFNKDQNRDPNESNDKSQLINQFQVASETIEGVLDTSGETTGKKCNATIIDDRDMSVLSDSVLSDCGSNANRTLSLPSSDDSFQKAPNLMGELDISVFSSKNLGGGQCDKSDVVSDDSFNRACGLTNEFNTTVLGSKKAEASMYVNESMFDATRTESDSMSSVTGADCLFTEFDASSTCIKPEHRLDSTIITGDTMCEATHIMSDTSSFVTEDSFDRSSMETYGPGKGNSSVSNVSSIVAREFFKELDSSISSDSDACKLSNQVEEKSFHEQSAHKIYSGRNIQKGESPHIIKQKLPTEEIHSIDDMKVTDELKKSSIKEVDQPPIDLKSPISKSTLTSVSSLEMKSENWDTCVQKTRDNSNIDSAQGADISILSVQFDEVNISTHIITDLTPKNSPYQIQAKFQDTAASRQDPSLVDDVNISTHVNTDLTPKNRPSQTHPDSQDTTVGMQDASLVGEVNISTHINTDLNSTYDLSQTQANLQGPAASGQDASLVEEVNISTHVIADLTPKNPPSQTQVDSQDTAVRMLDATLIGEVNISTHVNTDLTSKNDPSQTQANFQDTAASRQDACLVEEVNIATHVNTDLTAKSSPSQTQADSRDTTVRMLDASLVGEVNISTHINTDLTSKNDPSQTQANFQDSAASRQDASLVEEVNIATHVNTDLTPKNSPSQTHADLQDTTVPMQVASLVEEVNISTHINTDLSSKNDPSQMQANLQDTAAGSLDASEVEEVNISTGIINDLTPKNSPFETHADLKDTTVGMQDASLAEEENISIHIKAELTSTNGPSQTQGNLQDTSAGSLDASVVEEVNISTHINTDLTSKDSPSQPHADSMDTTAGRQDVSLVGEVNISIQKDNPRQSSLNMHAEAIEDGNKHNLEESISNQINSSLNNDSDVDMKVNHNDTSWLSYGGLQDFQDTESEETNDPVIDQMKQNLTVEVDYLMNCLSQNSLNIENWEDAKDDTVSGKIASTMSRITKLKAQNRLYTSQNLSYRQISEKSFVNTPYQSCHEPRKNDITIQKTCARGNTSSLSSDSWIVEATLNIPVANSTCLPEVPSSNDSTIKMRSYEEIKKDMRQEEFPSVCKIELENSNRIVLSIDQYAYHKFIIHYYAREITDIVMEKKVPQGLEAEGYVVNFMSDAINIPSLKTKFTTIQQIPQLLHAICALVKKWKPVALDVYRTFYKFLGRVSLGNGFIVVKFFVHKILEVFSVMLKLEGNSSRLLFVNNSRCDGIYQKVKEAIHGGYDKHPFPFLAVCERVELLCTQLAEETPVLNTFHNTSWCHIRNYVPFKRSEELDLGMDLFMHIVE